MKKYLMILSGFTGLLFLLTMVPSHFGGQVPSAAVPETATGTVQTATTTAALAEEASLCESYQMLDITSGKVEEISVREYVIGAVCAEMPATFEPEALKAQAVAAHTYAERQHMIEQRNPTPELCGADFSNDSSQYQACFTENQAQQYYGDSFEASYAKICDAVDEVLPYILQYDGEPIIAAFCSMSSGTTENAETVWGSAIDYLVSVESSADTTAPRYLETQTFTEAELQSAAEAVLSDTVWDGDPEQWIALGKYSDAGTLLTAEIGGQEVSGQELRAMLGLRSAAISMTYDDGSFVFTTRGYGHGVGMSQYGANTMAKDGAGWQEILSHYYPNTEVVKAAE